MTNESQEDMLPQHPVNLTAVNLLELFIHSNRPPDSSIDIEEKKLSIGVGKSNYDEENKIIRVAIKLEVGKDDTVPYLLRVILEGVFHVTRDDLSVEQINEWALKSSPYVLFPYLREHAFALTARAGFRPLILPLVQVPI